VNGKRGDQLADCTVSDQSADAVLLRAATAVDEDEVVQPSLPKRPDQVDGNSGRPKPPIMIDAPFGISATALSQLATTLSIGPTISFKD
jgi:hypothetical protein